MVIKEKISEWFWDTWDSYVKKPIAKKTEELENQTIQKIEEHSGKAKEQARKSLEYRKQESFYRGLFWTAIAFVDSAVDSEWELTSPE